ncbi:MAG: nickel/cobalt transporter (NicO) family protein [Frankiaceae bacterium]|nr:nickel/cobalt transporter (NicO) family protein [Frankiaceae bacterium]
MRAFLRATVVAAAAFTALPLFAGAAAAHPLGNFTVNHYTGLVVGTDHITLDVVVDTAEIPTFKRRGEVDTNGDKTIDDAERSAFAAVECGRELGRLSVRVAGRPAVLAVSSSTLVLNKGAAGLDTMRLTCAAGASIDLGRAAQIVLARADSGAHIGWREMTARGDGVTLSGSTVPAESISGRLTAYPQDLLTSPLAVDTAALTATRGGPRLAGGSAVVLRNTPGSRGVDRATAAFQNFVGHRTLSPVVGLIALLFAIVLGAVHALAPGHGKTVMAAFIVGERGSLRQAWIIGLTVTITHTAGVLVLGILFSAADLAAPRVYGLLGLASGLLLGSVGVLMLARAVRGRLSRRAAASAPEPHSHPHPHPHPHSDPPGHGRPHDHALDHSSAGAAEPARHKHGLFAHTHAVPAGARPLGLRSIVAMGFAGGLVPSPSALVVLLGAVALGRTWFGVVLVVAYGAGMAVTLTGTGLLLSRASGRLGAGAANVGPRLQRVVRAAALLPFVTAGVLLTVATTIAVQGLRAAL